MKKYPKYKDSGVPWLGQAPAHWEMKKLIHVAHEAGVKNAGMVEDNLLSLSYGRIIRKDIDTNEGLLPASFEGYQIVEEGDTVLRLTDLQNDQRSLRAGFVNERGIITSAYCAVRPTGISNRWLFNALRAADLLKVYYSMGGGVRQSLDFESIKRILIPVPPRAEQLAIDAYLVAEEERIRSVISSQERMIELLKERRSAIITQAVTKGLDPKAKMKDSGVPRLGLTPEKWEVIPLRYLGRLNGGAGFPDDEQVGRDGDINFFKVKHLAAADSAGCMTDSDNSISEEKAKRLGAYIFKPGTILFAKVGAALLLNRFRISDARCCADNNMMGFEPDERKVTSEFCCYAMHMIDFSDIVNPGTVPSINERQVSSISIPVPSLPEQVLIVNRLRKALSDLDDLSSRAAKCVNLLKERRSAIITLAVTGQIDVR